MATHSSILETPHGQKSLVVYSPWYLTESDTTERLSTHKMEKETQRPDLRTRGRERR